MALTASTNLANTSGFLLGSDTLKITPFFVKSLNIPGVAFSHISMPTRSGTKLNIGADSISFDSLELEVLLDSEFSTYFELLDIAFQEVDWDYDSFAMPCFDLWVIAKNSKGEEIFRFDFVNCRINSVGSLTLDPENELGASVAVSIAYDFYRWSRQVKVERCIEPGKSETTYETRTTERYYQAAPNISQKFHNHGKMVDPKFPMDMKYPGR